MEETDMIGLEDLNIGCKETEKFLKSLSSRVVDGISLTQGVMFAIFEFIDSFSKSDRTTKHFVEGCLKQYQEGKKPHV